jgi:hypothetical protein
MFSTKRTSSSRLVGTCGDIDGRDAVAAVLPTLLGRSRPTVDIARKWARVGVVAVLEVPGMLFFWPHYTWNEIAIEQEGEWSALPRLNSPLAKRHVHN